MKTKEKKKAHYGLLVLLFLLLGLGIQVGLGYQRLSRGEARSARLLEQLSLSARTAAENETQRRGGLWQEAAPRLTRLPELRQAARAGEDLSLLMLVNAEHPSAVTPSGKTNWLMPVEPNAPRPMLFDSLGNFTCLMCSCPLPTTLLVP